MAAVIAWCSFGHTRMRTGCSSNGIWLEFSWALDIKYAGYWKKYANGWRTDWDVECY
ncbi:hypothetical protein ABZV93_08285 [Actinopolymorpha sp. NPDC004070]|uniref:hypothetical protein n=1 Tax=Actinopolymorpha sp. NPDC004070 TaxID=3154548 RepID=UPI0033AE0B3C